MLLICIAIRVTSSFLALHLLQMLSGDLDLGGKISSDFLIFHALQQVALSAGDLAVGQEQVQRGLCRLATFTLSGQHFDLIGGGRKRVSVSMNLKKNV